MPRVKPIIFEPYGTHIWTGVAGGWLYCIKRSVDQVADQYIATKSGLTVYNGPCLAAAQIAAQRHHRQAVIDLLI